MVHVIEVLEYLRLKGGMLHRDELVEVFGDSSIITRLIRTGMVSFAIYEADERGNIELKKIDRRQIYKRRGDYYIMLNNKALHFIKKYGGSFYNTPRARELMESGHKLMPIEKLRRL